MENDPKMTAQETEEISVNAGGETYTYSNEATATEPFDRIESTEAASDSTDPNRKLYWYQRLGRSVGGSIAACVSALVVVALVSGFSAFAGASVATGDERHDINRIERTLDRGDGQMTPFDDRGDVAGKSKNMQDRNGMDSSTPKDSNADDSMTNRPEKDKVKPDDNSESGGSSDDPNKSKNADKKSEDSGITKNERSSEASA